MRMTTKAMHKAGAPTGKAYKQPEMGPICKSSHLLPSGCSSKGCPLWSSAFRYPLGVRPCTTSCTCRVLPSTSSSSNTYTNAVATSCAPCSQKTVLQELQMSILQHQGYCLTVTSCCLPGVEAPPSVTTEALHTLGWQHKHTLRDIENATCWPLCSQAWR